MLAPGDRIGDWIVESALGEGGMGAVYRAHNALVPDIVAAVKVLKPHAMQDARARFFREVQAVHSLHHPHIVRVSGFGEDPQRGLLWMAMDLLVGRELGDVIDSGPLPPDRAVPLFDGLVDALAHAHARGVFHRDLKPGNVLVDANGQGRLVDFGIAVLEGQSRLTSTGMVVGTPSYMPPEIFDAGDVDPTRADIYAMGQMLHEVLIGQAAFPEDPTLSDAQRMGRLFAAKQRTEALDPGDGVPAWLRDVVRAATDPHPSARTASAQDLLRQLRAEPPKAPAAAPAPTPAPTSAAPAPAAPATAATTPPASTPPPARPHRTPGPRRRRSVWPWVLGLGIPVVGLAGLVLVVLVLVVANLNDETPDVDIERYYEGDLFDDPATVQAFERTTLVHKCIAYAVQAGTTSGQVRVEVEGTADGLGTTSWQGPVEADCMDLALLPADLHGKVGHGTAHLAWGGHSGVLERPADEAP